MKWKVGTDEDDAEAVKQIIKWPVSFDSQVTKLVICSADSFTERVMREAENHDVILISLVAVHVLFT